MKLHTSSTQQKIAKNTQKVERVTMLIRVIIIQKTIGRNCPIQKIALLQEDDTRTCDASKHHLSSLSSFSLVYHLKAASCLPAMFLVTQKSKLTRRAIRMKVDKYWSVASLSSR